jgi:hypothetical protein
MRASPMIVGESLSAPAFFELFMQILVHFRIDITSVHVHSDELRLSLMIVGYNLGSLAFFEQFMQILTLLRSISIRILTLPMPISI